MLVCSNELMEVISFYTLKQMMPGDNLDWH